MLASGAALAGSGSRNGSEAVGRLLGFVPGRPITSGLEFYSDVQPDRSLGIVFRGIFWMIAAAFVKNWPVRDSDSDQFGSAVWCAEREISFPCSFPPSDPHSRLIPPAPRAVRETTAVWTRSPDLIK